MKAIYLMLVLLMVQLGAHAQVSDFLNRAKNRAKAKMVQKADNKVDQQVDRELDALDGPAPDAEVVWTWRQLRQSHGQLPISHLVTELGWSHSRLVNRFREQIGVTPKQCARLLRFQHVVRHPTFAPGADWCAIAQACGFYDQSHLIRDVRAFAGDTPEGLARRRLTASAGYAASEGEPG